MSKRRNGSMRRRRRLWLLRTLVTKYGGRCNACGDQVNMRHGHPKQATVDHVLPRSRGGNDALDNLQLLCRACNCDKADQFWDDYIGGEDGAT